MAARIETVLRKKIKRKLLQRWKTYKKHFENLGNAVGVNNERQKLSILLTYVG